MHLHILSFRTSLLFPSFRNNSSVLFGTVESHQKLTESGNRYKRDRVGLILANNETAARCKGSFKMSLLGIKRLVYRNFRVRYRYLFEVFKDHNQCEAGGRSSSWNCVFKSLILRAFRMGLVLYPYQILEVSFNNIILVYIRSSFSFPIVLSTLDFFSQFP